MPQRKTTSGGGRMARPRSGPRTKTGRASSSPSALAPMLVLALRVWGWLLGPIGQQLLSLVLIAFGLLTMLTIYGANSGVWISAWARFLVFAFGWGAYSAAALLIVLGLLWLRHLVHQPTAWRWREVGGAFQARRAARKANSPAPSPEAAAVTPPVVAVPPSAPAPPAPRPQPRRITVPPSGKRAMTSKSPTKSAPTRAKLTRAVPTSTARMRSAAPHDLPPLTLLKKTRVVASDPEETRRKSRIIEETLSQFGIPARVTEIHPGPTVTQFGVAPGYINRGEGGGQRKVRVSQIAALADDLALALAARSLRVEAPVPGHAVVGIEVPNDDIDIVALRGVLESERFHKCDQPLCFAVGLDVAGKPIIADLAAMPHLLVAGTTGSGKSVFVKALAASLVMFNAPADLRLIMIDPKMVELSHFNGLPHLLGRTETDVEQIIRVLRWVAHEMEARYKSFSKAVARNIDDYNRKMQRQGAETLPRIVVLIDELADLMMSVPEETERTLTRIAQMARATGIHLVVATQRPSIDVVTGLIKANFPARVTFATTSSVDSRVIIDTPGAESLLGRGDMLFLPPDAAAPVRVQGCFIADDELEALIQAWQKLAGATPAKAPWVAMAESTGPDALRLEGLSEDAGLLEWAIAHTKKQGHVSASGLQRRLRISYNRAARLVEEMEKMGLIGPQKSAGRKRRVIGGEDG